ncbi:MAG: hypothetical protein BRD21_09250 [Halobacteriales archaeon SW_8_66_22]|nr:MAG: hypothetical protein BRD21_09250 [Halobacteriales archaeon SW_8_66_22]
MTDRTRAHVYVSGKVQGVYFRATTREEARKQDVDGWVRNLDDGRVEAAFEGPEDDVESAIGSFSAVYSCHILDVCPHPFEMGVELAPGRGRVPGALVAADRSAAALAVTLHEARAGERVR